MGAVVGGLLGTSGGAGGTGFSGPQGANITNPVKAGQTDTAYTGVQNSQQAQQQLLQALQAQNGLQNQSNVYNQLQGVANGTGPNPAQAMLAQQTGQNVANQAALAAGQRGAAGNVGLMARQAAQQGANLQQQAVGQGATLQAQQALNAMGQMGNLATTQAGQQIGQTQANAGQQLAEQQALLNATQGVNSANVSNQASINAGNAGMATARMQGQSGLIGGVLNGVGGALGLAEGGEVPKYADGTLNVTTPVAAPKAASPFGPQSSFAKIINQKDEPEEKSDPLMNQAQTPEQQLQTGTSNFTEGLINAMRSNPQQPQMVAGGPMDAGAQQSNTMMAAKGGKVQALVSPGEKYLPPKAVEKVEKEGKNPMKVGETIPGKAKVKGARNSYANDTVPKTLEEGGIVLPRSVTQSKNPHWAAHKFVSDIMAKKGKK